MYVQQCFEKQDDKNGVFFIWNSRVEPAKGSHSYNTRKVDFKRGDCP